ncbi:hypothetical protein OQH61_03305 [Helicobacter sp. MIT 21-1697]|uniref:hypothetical protein n=1 Tax=Helicobacter sp. MIT 21-1697 TaxID=2993733 RepID=UPI00224B500F|nr:hypothetical protein [Helicobacter sp. MIT 21-1697]MCX2716760.1 hypothetical protein [Helicobacter sp. MIT 21-1697]
MNNSGTYIEVLIDVCIGIFYALQWIIYLFFGLKPPKHTNALFARHFYTLRLALPLRLLAAFALYVWLVKPIL